MYETCNSYYDTSTNEVLACSEFNWEWSGEQGAKEPDAIYHGMVVSISLDNQLIYDGGTDPLRNIISLRGKKHIKFKVFETLKGEDGSVLTAVLPECIGGTTGFGNTAILFKVGDVWHIKSLSRDHANEMAFDVLHRLSDVNHPSELQP